MALRRKHKIVILSTKGVIVAKNSQIGFSIFNLENLQKVFFQKIKNFDFLKR